MIIQRWGPVPKLSEYEYQYYQYKYVIDSDSLFDGETGDMIPANGHPDNLKLNEPFMATQNYVLVSQDERSLNALFASLCKKYQAVNAEILPYECSQSVLSSSCENMLLYYTGIIRSRIGGAAVNSETGNARERSEAVEEFHSALNRIDSMLEHPMILAIRNIQYLDARNVSEWLPADKYKNIRFMLSCDKVFPETSKLKEITSWFYFQDGNVFGRDRMIKSYMARYHKELDDQVYFALLDKAQNKDNQYLELLMQRLLVLSQDDFEAIKRSGDGMEKISQYLQRIISESPDTTADFILSQLSLLEAETSPRFAKAVLSVLSVLPYGISLTDLSGVLKAGNVMFSTLDMTLLCRRLHSVINVTLDGYYRMMRTPVTDVLTDILVSEIQEWSVLIERYMSNSYIKARQTGDEFYRSQYLEIALKTNKRGALSAYINNTGYDASYTALVLHRLASKESYAECLSRNFEQLTSADIKWMAADLYSCFSDKKMLLNKSFALYIIDCWKLMLKVWKYIMEPSEDKNYINFMLLFELGEMAYLHSIDGADGYLAEAKQISKQNFKSYPNRLWKMANGIELTAEEKRRGYDSMGVDQSISGSDSIIFGFDGEIEDMELEQSWSATVRVINNYLSHIYRERGDEQAADELEAESRKITHMSDPDPQHKGNKEIAPGIKIIWPDELDGDDVKEKAVRKRAYKPDLRRNSAIQIAKEACRLREEGQSEAAILKYDESNEILKEIYEDGHTGEYYDISGAAGNPDEIRAMIQNECARDIGLNLSGMILCMPIEESSRRLLSCVDGMLSWAHIYDDYRNNRQSKSDLENYYLLSAKVYDMFGNAALHFDRIVRDIDRYLTYRLEAHLNGEQTDDKIIKDRDDANRILYQAVIHNPQAGPQITDLLLRQSNAAVKANDFNGFMRLTFLAENLLKWMWENSYNWVGTHCSLEYIFFGSVNNQCMLWEQRQMNDRLKHDADRISQMLNNACEPRSVLLGIQGILRYAIQVFRAGEYKDAVPYADAVYGKLQRTIGIPDADLVDIYEKLLVIYSEAELLDKAHAVAVSSENLLTRMERAGYSEELRSSNITPLQYRHFIISKLVITYLNHAIALSRMGRLVDATKYLNMAEELSAKNPEAIASETGIAKRIALFKKNGLPKPKKDEDSERVYRNYRNEIEAALGKWLKGERFDISALNRIVSLIEKMTGIPEYEIYKDSYAVAKYYHVLNMLYASLNRKDMAYEMLRQAAGIADSDDRYEELYADIYSDMCVYEQEPESKLRFSQKSLAIYENLQKEGRKFSDNSYAMALFNASIILMDQGQYKRALELAQKASSIWQNMLRSNPSNQIQGCSSEAKRLVRFLEDKINHG